MQRPRAASVEAAMATAFWHVACVACGRPKEAIAALDQMLTVAPPGFAGWTIPVEPFFHTLGAEPAFNTLLTRLAERAR